MSSVDLLVHFAAKLICLPLSANTVQTSDEHSQDDLGVPRAIICHGARKGEMPITKTQSVYGLTTA